MIYRIGFDEEAEKAISQYKKSNPARYKKVQKLLDELALHPRTGTGHPEPLQKGNSVTYSRRITAKDRLIYNIYDDTISVLVLEIGGHYDDK
jgi:toxin YoeB